MNDKTKLILKITGVIMGGIAGIIGVILLFNFLNFSCIAKPEMLKEEPIVCKEAKTWTYYAAVTKNTAAGIDAANGNKACRDKLRYDDCRKEQKEYMDKYYKPELSDTEKAFVMKDADSVYDNCQKDMK